MTGINGHNFGGMPIDQVELGMQAFYSHTITDADVKAYAGLSGDNNPVHMSDEYAEKSRFKARIAHGLFSAGFFSALFGTRLPGPGCVYLSQNLRFKKPVYLGDTVVAEVRVTGINIEKKVVTFDTLCSVKGKIVIEGEAEIYIPRASRRLENN
ncbi:MaoC family dehydratase [Pseudomonas tolaasii]|uniref:MaoC family dehydratase n=1 Tax=Pseudomonas tolaasii TaxID=29442 RepID=UPI0003704BB4|nr:MaoC family dehydratase [Pseudomonas tolaasii]NVZ44367.1 MaoC family dehydratase [Pseudomonas tolaasii]NWA47228.1 MaoC family dehydratase [Pseudomonas tolaasii]NWC30732.1 MaoC family dehydratase [Pseudomonas tolaasii]NWC53049.1 MaoC family dehydratase [Pseudomonas tolaasii]NWE66189.1 MaoC family dehydratase [Pseudomonas tolaasii]